MIQGKFIRLALLRPSACANAQIDSSKTFTVALETIQNQLPPVRFRHQ